MRVTALPRIAALALIWSLAILLALGSETFDIDPTPPAPPVIVDFSVDNSGNIQFADGFTADTVTGSSIGGTFEKAANARITLRTVPVFFDSGTAWAASVLPTDADELLRGSFTAAIAAPLEFGYDRQPSQGQMRSDFEGTSTLVTFSSTGDAVSLQTGTGAARSLGFAEFRNAYTDGNRELDERMASKAYRILENLWLLARISETLHREIEQQLDMLASVGLQTNLSLSCDNPSGMPTPSYVLRWANDLSGIGSPGNGDNFTASWINCLQNADGRYLERDMDINDYQLANDSAPRTMSYTAEARSLFFATQELPAGSFPAANQERVNGSFTVGAAEQ